MSDETVYDPTHLADPHAPPFVPAPEWTTGEHFSETMLAPGVRATVSMVHGSSRAGRPRRPARALRPLPPEARARGGGELRADPAATSAA